MKSEPQWLGESDSIPEDCRRYTEIIIQSSKLLLSIISDIISIATIDAGQEKINKSEINLNVLLNYALNQILVKAEKQHILLNLSAPLSDHEAKIVTDETKLNQILSNLIGNAIKFTHHGHINVGCKIVKSQNNTLLQFFVEDTGIGIPAEMHEEIFKRFRQVENAATRNFGGSGLGLAITKAYVELLGGKIWVESEEGKGSTFYFTLPINLNLGKD